MKLIIILSITLNIISLTAIANAEINIKNTMLKAFPEADNNAWVIENKFVEKNRTLFLVNNKSAGYDQYILEFDNNERLIKCRVRNGTSSFKLLFTTKDYLNAPKKLTDPSGFIIKDDIPAKLKLETIDNICGDTWCEGEYDYIFEGIYQESKNIWYLKYITINRLFKKGGGYTEKYFFYACELVNIVHSDWINNGKPEISTNIMNQIDDCMDEAESNIDWYDTTDELLYTREGTDPTYLH